MRIINVDDETVMCFFFNEPATTATYTYLHTLSLHDALPISVLAVALAGLQSLPAQAADRLPGDATGPRLVPQSRTPETQVIRLRPGQTPLVTLTADIFYREIGRASCRERVCQYV